MRFATLASGSSGNATLVSSPDAALLLDCGLSVRETERRLAALNFDVKAIHAIFLTHEHDDHLAGAAAFSRKYEIPVFATHGTTLAAGERLADSHELRKFRPEQCVSFRDIDIMPATVPHDAREPCQFIVENGGRRLGLLTDLGAVTPHIVDVYQGLDGLILEFNHDAGMLADGPYPANLKARIGGQYGHLSNDQATALVAQLTSERLSFFVAAHLSKRNNRPASVASAIQDVLSEDVEWYIAAQDKPSAWCDLGAD